MAYSDLQKKMQLMKEKQSRWMRERDMEQAFHFCAGVTELALPQIETNTLVDLTENIEKRIRRELGLQTSLTRPLSPKLAPTTSEVDETPVDCIECPICFTIMLPPQNSPMMIVPCGHSYCERCLMQHYKYSNRLQCPLCRKKIESYFRNITLQQIIESVVEKSRKKMKEFSLPPIEPICDKHQFENGSLSELEHSYQHQISSITTRCDILKNEMNNSQMNLEHLEHTRKQKAAELDDIAQEIQEYEKIIEDMQNRVVFLKNNQKNVEVKFNTIQACIKDHSNKVKLSQSALNQLEIEKDKISLILEELRRNLS